jgi:glycosyltransferase involved in cell wall biosynthesis
MRLSIILPVYNSAAFLPQCLDSILDSLDEESELIIVNDGSTDESESVISEYQSKWPDIRSISQPNRGVSAARNVGIDCALGHYITFVDSDDWIEPDIHREMMERMERTGTDLAVTGYVFEPSGRIIQCDSWGIPSVIRNCTDGGMHFLIDSQFFNMVWNKMFRADIIHNRRIRFDEKVHYGEDGIFLMKYLAAVNSVSVDDAPMYHYRFRNDSLSHDPRIDRHPYQLESVRIRHNIFQEWGLSEESTGWIYRDKILDIISKTVSTYHYGNPGRQSIRRNLVFLRTTLQERHLQRFGRWIFTSRRTWLDKIKLGLFYLRLDGVLSFLHWVYHSRYR